MSIAPTLVVLYTATTPTGTRFVRKGTRAKVWCRLSVWYSDNSCLCVGWHSSEKRAASYAREVQSMYPGLIFYSLPVEATEVYWT